MKVNTKDTDSLVEKSFAKYPLNSEKKTFMPGRFNKNFLFSICSPLQAVQVLAFCTPRAPIQYEMFFKEQ